MIEVCVGVQPDDPEPVAADAPGHGPQAAVAVAREDERKCAVGRGQAGAPAQAPNELHGPRDLGLGLPRRPNRVVNHPPSEGG
jgi:hypothetical protein